jgi:hypothetical protein
VTQTLATPFDPNFEALLREAAASPRSMLLRVERPQVFQALRSREAPASVAMAGLSSVERELLSTYRAELGLLLRQATLASLLSDTEASKWIDPTTTDKEVHSTPPWPSWCPSARAALSACEAETEPDLCEAAKQLADLIDTDCNSTDIIGLLSLRVEPKDQSRIYVGAYFAARGESGRSLEALKPVLDGQASASNEAFALESMALALARTGDYKKAVDSIRMALGLGVQRPELALRYLFYSVLASSTIDIATAISRIGNTVAADHPAVASLCQDIITQTEAGYWQVPLNMRYALRAHINGTSEASNRIINAIIGEI